MPDESKKDLRTHAVIGAAMEVHPQLGCRFPEAVCQEAFRKELLEGNIPFQREIRIPIFYQGSRLVADCRADFVLIPRWPN